MKKLFVSVSVKKHYMIGTCVNSFDDDGYSINNIPYSDVTEFAQAEEKSKIISKEEFLKYCVVEPKYKRILNSKYTKFLYDKANKFYMMYDTNKDIHYFFAS